MKLQTPAKNRIRLEVNGKTCMLLVDQVAVVSTQDAKWLRKFAAKLRKNLAGE